MTAEGVRIAAGVLVALGLEVVCKGAVGLGESGKRHTRLSMGEGPHR